jgi:hypothetical protein
VAIVEISLTMMNAEELSDPHEPSPASNPAAELVPAPGLPPTE